MFDDEQLELSYHKLRYLFTTIKQIFGHSSPNYPRPSFLKEILIIDSSVKQGNYVIFI